MAEKASMDHRAPASRCSLVICKSELFGDPKPILGGCAITLAVVRIL